jgi:xanthine dehydrogenase YagR molybdenum-binding subunit
MVVAEEMGLPVEAHRVKIGDTRYPFGPASGGSVTTGSLIPAVRAAAVHAREKLVGVAAKVLGEPESEVRIAGGIFSAKGKTADFKKVCSRLPGETLVATGDRAKDYDGTDTRLFGAQFAEVVVDVETGVTAVKKVVAVHDCGQPVWKTGVESQIRGGILQGISYALFEERIVDERSGRVLNPNVEFYKILGSKDTPEIVPLLVDHYPGKNNAHARGIGEPATVPTAAAVANAIAHATGVRPTALPITPARLLALLGKVPAREVRA